MLKNQYRAIIKNNIGGPYNYKAKKFVNFCSKINEDLEALTKDIGKALCVVYTVPAKSLPPNSVDILSAQLTEMGFDVRVEAEWLSNAFEREDIKYYKIRIRCKEEVTEDEENIKNRDTELSEPQEHND